MAEPSQKLCRVGSSRPRLTSCISVSFNKNCAPGLWASSECSVKRGTGWIRQPLPFLFKSSNRLQKHAEVSSAAGQLCRRLGWDACREHLTARAAQAAREPTQGQRVTATEGHHFSSAGSAGVAGVSSSLRSVALWGRPAGETEHVPARGGVHSRARAFSTGWLLGTVRVDAPVSLGYAVKTRFLPQMGVLKNLKKLPISGYRRPRSEILVTPSS